MPRFSYPCPGCRTTNSLHDPDCRFEGTPWPTIEKAYIDCLAVLTAEELTEAELRSSVDSEWSDRHTAALATLKSLNRIEQADDGTLRLLTAAEYAEQVSEPSIEPMATIYEHGSVPGCHDNAVFAMIAWYEMVDLSWPETKDNVVTWLRESGAWDRGGFEESSPEELVESKRHVYESGYGWKQAGQEAKAVIDRHLG
ncbi:hypothetical protein DM826_12495 [Halonotius aquaticus]|uniref:Uncharacterized protein n=1 Tax=Halonotius aquaticus TaxID=2216978 RepID=A0A3A6PLV1_9EURY|nr:hypothetical protein [Halonotius aquaticus]RJX42449.1 hypothetical protein DM826_12495 [Halonotius aquaticus]